MMTEASSSRHRGVGNRADNGNLNSGWINICGKAKRRNMASRKTTYSRPEVHFDDSDSEFHEDEKRFIEEQVRSLTKQEIDTICDEAEDFPTLFLDVDDSDTAASDPELDVVATKQVEKRKSRTKGALVDSKDNVVTNYVNANASLPSNRRTSFSEEILDDDDDYRDDPYLSGDMPSPIPADLVIEPEYVPPHKRLALCPVPHCQHRCKRSQMRSHHRRAHRSEAQMEQECRSKREYRRKQTEKAKAKAVKEGKEFKKPTAVCPYCQITILKESYRVHVRNHTNKSDFPCPKCSKSYSYACHLKIHLKSHEPPSMQCEMCSNKFATKGGLIQHIKATHLGVKKHFCMVCNKGFYQKNCLRMHMSTHADDREFKCSDCGKLFLTQNNLRQHQRRVHPQPGDLTFKCEHCPATFSTKQTRHTHEMYCEKGPNPFPKRPEPVLHFQCRFCDRKFADRFNFQCHEKYVHLGEPIRTHQCEGCGKGHIRKYQLTKHRTKCSKLHVEQVSKNPSVKKKEDIKTESSSDS